MSSLRTSEQGDTTIGFEPRARVELRLSGGVDGALALDDLAEVARHAQELVRGLARAIVDRAKPGRPPAYLEDATELFAVGIRPGSAVLEIEAPARNAAFDMPDEVGFDVGIQALEMVAKGLDSIAKNEPLPPQYSPTARGFLRNLINATSSYDRLEWRVTHDRHETVAAVTPADAVIPEMRGPMTRLPKRETVEGELYALNARTGTYTLEDLTHYSVKCHVEPDSTLADRLDRLVRRTVSIHGVVHRDSSGRITDVDVEEAGIPDEAEDRTFWGFDLEAALSAIKPIDAIEALAISGLSTEEADSFRQALGFE